MGFEAPSWDPILGRKTMWRQDWVGTISGVLVPITMFQSGGGSELPSDVDCAPLHRLASHASPHDEMARICDIWYRIYLLSQVVAIDESSYGILPLMLPPGLISPMHKSLINDSNVLLT
jgi:hypothetical protein